LVGDATRLAGFDPRDVASGLVLDDVAFVRRKATSPCEAALRSPRSRVGRYIGPGGRSGNLTYSANLNNAHRCAWLTPSTGLLAAAGPVGVVFAAAENQRKRAGSLGGDH